MANASFLPSIRLCAVEYKAADRRDAPSQALPRQLPRRGSQAVKFSTKVLSTMSNLPAVGLPLPLGEVDLRSKDGEGAGRANPLCFFLPSPVRVVG